MINVWCAFAIMTSGGIKTIHVKGDYIGEHRSRYTTSTDMIVVDFSQYPHAIPEQIRNLAVINENRCLYKRPKEVK